MRRLSILIMAACGAASGTPTQTPAPAVEAVAEPARTVAEAFVPPDAAVRVRENPFGLWLRDLPVAGPDVPVKTFDGRHVSHDARVVELDMVPGDLQQCADSVIRLRAQYLVDQGDEVMFHATSGDELPWAKYAAGERPFVKSERIAWRSGSSKRWDDYLAAVFMWAGTWSLEHHDTVAVDTPEPGDVVVQGGFPGHAVILLDVAERDGETFVLVGEGFMPAQSFHVEIGPVEGWWAWTDDGLELPHWTLPATALRRWKPAS
jgi:hypothetical protein